MTKISKTEELLDLVDKNDKIIGNIPNSKPNSNPKIIHREIAIIIYDDKNRVLIQQRSFKKRLYPGVWTVTCAGHVTYGLTPLETAHMELLEEVGFDTKLKFVEKEFNKIPTESRFFYWYVGKLPKNAKVKIEPREVESIKLLSQSQLKKFIQEGNKVGKHSVKYLTKFWASEL